MRVRRAIGLDGSGDAFQITKSLLFVAANGRLVPFNLKRREIEKKHANGKNFPGRIFPDQAHQDMVRVATGRRVWIGSVAYIDRKQCEIVAEISAAKLDIRGAVRSSASNRVAA